MRFITFLSEATVPLMTFYIVGPGPLSGRPVLDGFTNGTKDGMKTVAGILSTLTGPMVSVGVLRAFGFPDFLGKTLMTPVALIYLPPQIAPVILVRLVPNSAAIGLVLDTFKEFGTDSGIGLIVPILMSSTETALYCMSVYFGSVGIRKTRHTLAGGLIAVAVRVAMSVVLIGAASG